MLLPAAGYGNSPVFERISLSDGLSQSSVQAIAQGPRGYLWIGTQSGLDRFDGYGFHNFGADTESSNGLSHWFVRDLLFDRENLLWIGTSNGLNRLDPQTGRVRQYFPQNLDREQPALVFKEASLVEDMQGNIMATTSLGPVRWNRSTDALEFVDIDWGGAKQPNSRSLKGSDGAIWLASRNRIWRFDTEQDRFLPMLDVSDRSGKASGTGTQNVVAALPGGRIAWATEIGLFLIPTRPENDIRHLRPIEFGLSEDRIDAVALDSHGDLWLRTPNALIRATGAGLDEWKVMLDAPKHIDSPRNNRHKLDLVETRDGRIWLGGRFGVALLDPSADRLRLLLHDPENRKSLPPTLAEAGYTLLADRFGVLWVGTNLGGLARLSPQSTRFMHVRDARPGSRSRNVVRAISEQNHSGNEWVWVSNQNAGITVWQRHETGQYSRVAEYARTLGNLSADTLRAITPAPDGSAVWMAGDGWLGRAAHPGSPIDVAIRNLNGSVRALRFDDAQRLWAGAGTWLGAFKINSAGGATLEQEFNVAKGAHPRFQIFSVCFRENGQLVAGGYGGLAIVDPENADVRRFLPGGRPGDIPKNLVFHVHCADNGAVWFGTRGAGLGRARFDGAGNSKFDFIGTEQGLVDDTVYAILEGTQGEFWLSSNRGLMRYFPESGEVESFGLSDGLQEYEFNNTVADVGASGRYYFGGIDGWNVFDPDTIERLPGPPIVHAEMIRVNGRKISASTAAQDKIELNYNQNRLEIEYIGLHFSAPEQVEYAYRLKGLDDNWISTGNDRLARYASLPPGDYSFEVKAANPDGVWSAPKPLFRATVNPAPWNKPWAWGAYTLALLALLWMMVATHRKRERRLQALVERRTSQLREQHGLVEQKAAELKDALDARTTLFANISHEFRTPLTLIGAAFDKLEPNSDPNATALGRRYVNRLLRLVEQLLDLSRLKSLSPGRVADAWRLDRLVAQTVQAFESVARQKNISLEPEIDGQWNTRCPHDMVEKILLNLLTNAVKYTPKDGCIEVALAGHSNGAELSVRDSGPGIPQTEQAVVFERFYRTESAETGRSHGAGIGLALVKEAVAVLGGSIRLESTPGTGSTFAVLLPARRVTTGNQKSLDLPESRRRQLELDVLEAGSETGHSVDRNAGPNTSARGTILVVEDNDDLRAWIAKLLAHRWRVIEAADGRVGLDQARRQLPDIIVSDLMMPVLDGFGMLEALREDIETSHIPVLMLTARQDDQTRLKAFMLSADAFLSKPFNVDELKARLEQIAASRQRLQNHLQGLFRHHNESTTPEPQELGDPQPAPTTSREPKHVGNGTLSRHDRELIERVETWLEKCYSDPETDIKAMAKATHVTPRTLQRKLKALTGDNPAHLLRNHRLQRACRQLTDTDRPISEIAHACGFSSAQYFSRVFRDAFGQSPNTWRQGHD